MSEQKLILISFLLMTIHERIHSPTGHLRTFWTGNYVINGTSTHNICSKVSILESVHSPHQPYDWYHRMCRQKSRIRGSSLKSHYHHRSQVEREGVRVGMRLIACSSFFFVLWRMLLDNEKRSNSTFPLVCRNIPGSDLPWTSFFIMIVMIQVIVEWYMDQHPHI